jgi:FtsZ-binding cell division protein ZapB
VRGRGGICDIRVLVNTQLFTYLARSHRTQIAFKSLISQRTAGEGHHAYAKARDAIETIEAAGSEFVKKANADVDELLHKTQWLSKRVRYLEGELARVNKQATERIRALQAKVDASETGASAALKTTSEAELHVVEAEDSAAITSTSEQAQWLADRVKFLESELLHIRTTANKRVQALKQQVDQLRASTAAVAAGTNATAAAGGATQIATEEHPSAREVERLRHEVAMADQTAHVLRAEKAELTEKNVELTEEIADLRRANADLLRQLRGAESAPGGESQPDVSANDRRLDEQSRVIEEQKKLIAQLMELVNT